MAGNIKRIVRRRILTVVMVLILAVAASTVIINIHIVREGGKYILAGDEVNELLDTDCIIVLGAQVLSGGRLSHMLEDRVRQGVALYMSEVSGTLLMSGDGRTVSNDEPGSMKAFAVELGTEDADIVTDPGGFSTFETMLRARDEYGVKKVVIVTQEYHLYRSVYIARKLGLEAYGVSSDLRRYVSEPVNQAREALARVKAFGMILFID